MKVTFKKVAGAAFAVMFAGLVVSCGSNPKLYSWYNYQTDYYHYVKNNDKESLEDLLKTYDKIIAKQSETRGIVPPGIYADYGYLLLEAGKKSEAAEMFAKELELYPESETFISSLIKRTK